MAKLNTKNNRLIWVAVLLLMVVVFFGMLSLLRSITQKETYYILNTDVSSKILVTTDMLDPVEISKGSEADLVFNETTLGITDIQAGGLYTKYPLKAGDMLTTSNVGPYENLSAGVPDEWGVTSFRISAENALGGRITRGTYFDILISTPEASTYPFVNVLTLDATSSIDNPNLVGTEEAYTGEISEYVVAMPVEDIARLHNILATHKDNENIKLVLSPQQNEYAKPSISEYSGEFTYTPEDLPKNMGEETDYTFTPVERDIFGRPIPQDFTGCSDGNAQISEEDCQRALETPSE